MLTKQSEIRQIIVNKYIQNRSSSISDIAKELKFSRTTIRDVVKKFILIVLIKIK